MGFLACDPKPSNIVLILKNALYFEQECVLKNVLIEDPIFKSPAGGQSKHANFL